MKHYCTYCDSNYLARALALAASLSRNEQHEYTLYVVCLDEVSRLILTRLSIANVQIIPLHSIERDDSQLLQAKRSRSLVEYYWTLTPTIALRIIERNPEIDILTYLDSDLYFFSSPEPILSELGFGSVLIHEHRYCPPLAHLEATSGRFNVGLLVFRADSKALRVLRHWREQCLEWCYARTENGKMGDQMYLNEWPDHFDCVRILENIGAGLAPWNVDQYSVGRDSKQGIIVNNQSAIFFHFHSLEVIDAGVYIPTRHQEYVLSPGVLREIYLPYLEELDGCIGKLQAVVPHSGYGLTKRSLSANDRVVCVKNGHPVSLSLEVTHSKQLMGAFGSVYARTPTETGQKVHSTASSGPLAVSPSEQGSLKSLVSICIITNCGLEQHKERRSYLDRLLKSIQVAGFPRDRTEILIAGAYQGEGANRVINEPELAVSGQVCRLRNLLVQASTGQLIVHCDDDILFTPGYWESVLGQLDKPWDILCTRILNPNGTRYWDWAAHYPERGQTLLPYDVHDDFVYATGGHAVYRRSVFESVRWNEAMRHGDNEEFDFAKQVRAAKLKFACQRETTVYLQYHHCDALAAVTAKAPAADTPCPDFERAMATVCGPKHISRPNNLLARLAEKIESRPPARSQSQGPKVSVLVCCYKYLQRFRAFANSLCHQDIGNDSLEIVVANPQSPDGLSEYLAMLERAGSRRTTTGGRRGPSFREVSVEERHRFNRGYLVQRAFEQSSGEIVIGMDCDLILPENFISQIAAAVEANPDRIVGAYRKFLSRDTTEAILGGFVEPLSSFSSLAEEDCSEEQGYRGVLGYCQALTRKAWQQVGYPEEFDQINHSDVCFIERLERIDVRPLFLKDTCALHLNHERNWAGTKVFL